MVAHPQHVVGVTLYKCLAENGLLAQVPVAVALHIGLGEHIQAILVAQVIEVGVVGVMRCAHCIDVEAFHRYDVLLGLFACNHAAVFLAEVVAVYAVEDDSLAVDEERTVLANAHLAESYLAAAHVHHLALAVKERDREVVEVGLLGIPQARRLNIPLEGILAGAVNCGSCSCYGRAISVDSSLECSLEGIALDGHVEVGGCVHIVVVEVGGEEIVAYLGLGRAPQEYVALYAGESPVVLVLEQRTAGKAVHLHGDGIGARVQILRNLKLRGQVRVLTVAHNVAVYPKVIAVSGAVAAHIHIATLPVLGQHEGAAV